MFHYLFISEKPSLKMAFWVFPFIYLGIVLMFDSVWKAWVDVYRFELNLYFLVILANVWILRVWQLANNVQLSVFKFLARLVIIPPFVLMFGITCSIFGDFAKGTISLTDLTYYKEQVFTEIEATLRKSSRADPDVQREIMKLL